MTTHLNIPIDQGGGWIISLLDAMRDHSEVELGIVCSSSSFERTEVFSENGARYFCISHRPPTNSAPARIANHLYYSYFEDQALTDKYLRAFDDFKPDLIHFHGSEHSYGLIADKVAMPCVLSLQGILSEYYKVYFGRLGSFRRLTFVNEMFGYVRMRLRARQERKIFRRVKHFLGRTEWDRACVEKYSLQGKYYWGGELIRPEFFEYHWDISKKTDRRIVAIVSCLPYKGIDVLLNAVARLQIRFPDVSLHIGGNIPFSGFGAYLRNMADELGIRNKVTFLGKLDALQIVGELEGAHVFVLPSFLENSPNSLAEAQLIGTPIVATNAGGVSSMLDDGKTGLLCPVNDDKIMADKICRFFDDDLLAQTCSDQSRLVSRERHNSPNIINSLLDVYQKLAKGS